MIYLEGLESRPKRVELPRLLHTAIMKQTSYVNAYYDVTTDEVVYGAEADEGLFGE